VPLPRWLAKLNVRVTNPILGIVARRVPPFAMLRHIGRGSGRTYETPIMVFRRGNVGIIALTYGPSADWVQNVLNAGNCELVVRGRATPWTNPDVVPTTDVGDDVPALVRFALRLLRCDDFLRLQAAVRPIDRSQ
jgi:deazaflavin-dependent oxidoreductase (nitroreductase family)